MSYPAKILLIKLVRQHEELWNTRSAHYCRSDIKARAWEEISACMEENGFESKSTVVIIITIALNIRCIIAHSVPRIKTMWKNLRDQWKRNLTVKVPAEREWYFQKRINFLADTYDGRWVECLAPGN
ncbi:hypothetical protein OESDEN_20916 [Oesophagostomum dentatum]|uniref:MADF domain-containing protein n=1 Tax=Oesophagostomum dentatum TaxID=61180 RepID=A0A0B1S254_OESDE|nr:hypothetical protein OESDEN_20916 [Oesophagostomum dentatum]